ncbi:MAG: hypothetical protein M3071_24645 [Actinomycetota bacterium]|nr:hypothetical protein [Actinomycetota bacterium]
MRKRHPHPVAGAAQGIAALIAQDVSAAIDPQAGQQIGAAFQGLLAGGAVTTEHQLAAVAQQITELEEQGQIASGAAPALNGALANLRSALSATSPHTPTAGGRPSPDGPGHPVTADRREMAGGRALADHGEMAGGRALADHGKWRTA